MLREKYKAYIRPMLARDRSGHRAATELELLFDLVFVIAISLSAEGLHHATAEAHYLDGLTKFLIAFFALWWPWKQFTWFASAFDNDDAAYRISTLVMMFGALLIAGSLPLFFNNFDIRLMSIGYVVLRIPQIYLWWRVGRDNSDYCVTAQRHMVGMLILQPCWLILAFLTDLGSAAFVTLVVIGMVLECAVPIYANNAKSIPWHKHHIVERYGLLNIIVLGEILVSAALGVQSMTSERGLDLGLGMIALCATIIPFTLWWLYFNEEEHLTSEKAPHVLLWSYGHFFIFASGAAIGAGFSALIDAQADSAMSVEIAGKWVVSIAVATYLFGLWLVRDRHLIHLTAGFTMLGFAALIAFSPIVPFAQLPIITVLLVAVLFLRLNAPSK
ncbi:low temperature requirement protein A [Enterovibrio coralii]|uniref:Low temperature requirement protein A n=1 Tax=Enterovibrio coralii TaxID=294935 RepID=A0A135IBQ8_9GAMM|nr:low temperature requirement protein A [Enterovibrio coralii]KXF82828.1 hypothetical protein ATN88_23420 [Enterovibrio coralii]